MPPVSLKPLYHRQQECIGIYYDNNSILNNIVKKLPGAKWSQTNGCWYLALNKDNYTAIHLSLRGKAEIHTNELQQYLEKRNLITKGQPKPVDQKSTRLLCRPHRQYGN